MSEVKQFCTFYLDRKLFGVEVTKVQEVIRYQDMTEVPLAHPVIRGLLNLRGSIVSTIDLRRRFHLPALDAGHLPTNVVAQTPTGMVSFLVDRIGDVVEVTEDQFEISPASASRQSLIEGVYKLNHTLLQILSVERVLELDGALS